MYGKVAHGGSTAITHIAVYPMGNGSVSQVITLSLCILRGRLEFRISASGPA